MESIQMKKKGTKTQAEIDWENRALCSDESCIGVIGPDGRCKECGLTFGAEVRDEEPADSPSEAGEMADEVPEPEIETEEADVGEDRGGIDWESRTLCSDESCIGVIGPDGRCRECGLAYSSRTAADTTESGEDE